VTKIRHIQSTVDVIYWKLVFVCLWPFTLIQVHFLFLCSLKEGISLVHLFTVGNFLTDSWSSVLYKLWYKQDVRGFVHHSTILTVKNPTRCNNVSEFYYCFKRSWTCWTLSGSIRYLTSQQLHIRQPSTCGKPEAACAVLGSLWWAACRPKHVELCLKHVIIKFWYTVASCWVFFCKNCDINKL
jgi:hypothetical protein